MSSVVRGCAAAAQSDSNNAEATVNVMRIAISLPEFARC
jgi:hypothetical protein